MEPATVLALSEADAALGHLHGLGHLITDPQLPVGPYITRDALASSRIEGTQASLAEVLQAEARGEDRLPGQLRRSPVWVGSPTDNPDTAIFVPPLPEHLAELLTDWAKFVNAPGPLPVLARCALMHYQFETIHPFLDGNGRIGRLLIGLLLQQEDRLTNRLLYLSGYLESHRREY